MSKLVYAIGCCLLLAAPVGCARQAPSAGTASNGAGMVEMDETNEKVADIAAKANGWDVADVVVTDIPGGVAGACRLVGVRSNNALPSITKTYAVIDDGQVVAHGDDGALARVLDACGPDAPASLWAEAIVAFHEGRPPGRVARSEENISSIAHKWAVANGGYTFHPPRFAADGTVEFFMTDVEGNRLFMVRGSRRGDGPVEVSVEPAGKR